MCEVNAEAMVDSTAGDCEQRVVVLGKKKGLDLFRDPGHCSSGGRIRTYDLRVMSCHPVAAHFGPLSHCATKTRRGGVVGSPAIDVVGAQDRAYQGKCQQQRLSWRQSIVLSFPNPAGTVGGEAAKREWIGQAATVSMIWIARPIPSSTRILSLNTNARSHIAVSPTAMEIDLASFSAVSLFWGMGCGPTPA